MGWGGVGGRAAGRGNGARLGQACERARVRACPRTRQGDDPLAVCASSASALRGGCPCVCVCVCVCMSAALSGRAVRLQALASLLGTCVASLGR